MSIIHNANGDIFSSEASALINTVNTQGVMGKGLALQFKNRYPAYFTDYQQLCRKKLIAVGKCTTYQADKLLISFPTKDHWSKPSEYKFITEGLKGLKELIIAKEINSIAIPPLGCGLGGLNWLKVRTLIELELANLPIEIWLYSPKEQI